MLFFFNNWSIKDVTNQILLKNESVMLKIILNKDRKVRKSNHVSLIITQDIFNVCVDLDPDRPVYIPNKLERRSVSNNSSVETRKSTTLHRGSCNVSARGIINHIKTQQDG